jgi:hypothetical protein
MAADMCVLLTACGAAAAILLCVLSGPELDLFVRAACCCPASTLHSGALLCDLCFFAQCVLFCVGSWHCGIERPSLFCMA